MKKRPKPARKQRDKGPIEQEEQGAIVKQGKGMVKAALVYPNTYKAGMSSLGFQTVYRLANQMETIACERIFLPDHRQKNQQIRSLETGLSLDKFDIILFSISFENDFIHVIHLLEETGIPLRSSHRTPFHPLVVAGGVACFLNPEPIAPFMDLFLLGEAECLIEPFFKKFQKALSRSDFLSSLESDLAGAYVPSRHLPILHGDTGFNIPPARIQVQYLSRLDQVKTTTTIMSSGTAFQETFLIEILKGCPHGCRFCTAGFIYRPPRIYPKQTLFQAIDQAKEKAQKIGLVSSAVLDHPDIQPICLYARNQGLKLSFSSLRADKLTDDIIEVLAESGVKTATIAPEAGSERMRNIINKHITQQDILKGVKNLVSKGIINLKLYFMIGLPFETDQDVHAIVCLAQEIKAVFLQVSQARKKIGTITLSINPFIPKPFTPFQWSAMTSETTLKHRMDIIRQGLKKTANVKINFESLREARHQALLSLGDRNTADILEQAVQYGWTRALKMNQAYCDTVLYQEKPRPGTRSNTLLPWDILEHRVSGDFLVKEFKKAFQEKKSPPCPMKECSLCRICLSSNEF